MFIKFSMKCLTGSENFMICFEAFVCRREKVSNTWKCLMFSHSSASSFTAFFQLLGGGEVGGRRSLPRLAAGSQRQREWHFPWKQSEEFPKQGSCLNYAAYFSLPNSPSWFKWFIILASPYPASPSGLIALTWEIVNSKFWFLELSFSTQICHLLTL